MECGSIHRWFISFRFHEIEATADFLCGLNVLLSRRCNSLEDLVNGSSPSKIRRLWQLRLPVLLKGVTIMEMEISRQRSPCQFRIDVRPDGVRE